MVLAITLTLLLQAQPLPNEQVTAGRYELAERLKALDVAWMATANAPRRPAAVGPITAAVGAFFGGRYSAAAEQLDEAVAQLEGKPRQAGAAINVRPTRLFLEPGERASIQISWAYLPKSGPVTVSSGRQNISLAPGTPGVLEVDPAHVNPELGQNREVGYLLPVRVDGELRHVYLSIVKGSEQRIERLQQASHPVAKETGDLLARFIAAPHAMEAELPLIQYLFAAEQLVDGRTTLHDLEQVFYARHRAVPFRAAFPKSLLGDPAEKPAVTVVIALHGAGGSENMFFESYGRGSAVSEALKRGWVFMSPRTGNQAAQACLDWLISERGLKVNRIFLIGHSMGGGAAYASRNFDDRVAGIALLAPAIMGGIAENSPPTFLAVGKQEMAPLRASANTAAQQAQGRAGFQFKEYDPSEHLMVVADAIPDVYSFFDRQRPRVDGR
jgi:pimeloyl-ACP methyl ester carboxylesterase